MTDETIGNHVEWDRTCAAHMDERAMGMALVLSDVGIHTFEFMADVGTAKQNEK